MRPPNTMPRSFSSVHSFLRAVYRRWPMRMPRMSGCTTTSMPYSQSPSGSWREAKPPPVISLQVCGVIAVASSMRKVAQ